MATSDEPSPRFWHSAQLVGDKVYVRGGCTREYKQKRERSELLRTVDEFNVQERKWRKVHTKGEHHPGLTAVACASFGKHLYSFGGNDSSSGLNAVLSQLDVETLVWSRLSSETTEGPMTKDASGIVHISDSKDSELSLAVVCGYADPRNSSRDNGGSSDVNSRFFKRRNLTRLALDGGGWTNEMHIFNIKKGRWSCPTFSGSRPPPCADFTFTSIDLVRAVLYGGDRGINDDVKEIYIFDFHYLKIEKIQPTSEQDKWPKMRMGQHAACCLGFNTEFPHLLMSGGRIDRRTTLQDIWILNIKERKWKEILQSDGVQVSLERWGHSVTTIIHSDGLEEVLMFGGSLGYYGIWTRYLKKAFPRRSAPVSYVFGILCEKKWTLLDVDDSGSQWKTKDKDSSFDNMKSQFNMEALYAMEKGGIHVLTTLLDKNQMIRSTLNTGYGQESNIYKWPTISGKSIYEPTWENLCFILEEVDSAELARKIELNIQRDHCFQGVEFCGEIPKIVTNTAETFPWKGFGITFHIQQNRLPPDTKQITINTGASIAGQYQFPENYYLVSAVYWFRCEPQCDFETKITLEIEHCAKLQNNSRLSFARALCSQKPPYTFECVKGGQFSSHDSLSIILKFNRDCFGVAVIQEGSKEKYYYARLFYVGLNALHHEVHLAVTLNTAAHITDSERKYKKKNAQQGPGLVIEFESDRITLHIPEYTINNLNGWKLFPQANVEVQKKFVDEFMPGRPRDIPQCHLLVEAVESSTPETLRFKVHLSGTKGHQNVTICIEGFEKYDIKHYEAYKKALREETAVSMRYLKLLFFGPPRSGKSTTRRRLIQEIVNLSCHGEPSASTGVTEVNEVIIKKMTCEPVAITSSKWQSMKRANEKNKVRQEETLGEEDLGYLAQLFYRIISVCSHSDSDEISNNVESLDSDTVYDPKQDSPILDKASETQDAWQNCDLENKHEDKVNKASDATREELSDASDADVFSGMSQVCNRAEKIEVNKAFEKLKAILQSDSPKELRQLLEELIIISMADVGGQPAFLDMLPALTIGPALYVLFFRLDQNLKGRHQVRFRAADSKAEIKLSSSYCTEEVIHQSLSSVACFGYHTSQEDKEASCHAILMGTFRDQVSVDQISKIESTLNETFKGNRLWQKLLLKSSDGKMFFTVDNMYGTDESEMSEIRKNIEDIIKGKFDTISIPGAWLMFRIVLHILNKPVVSLTQCKEIGEKLFMHPTQVKSALFFFHHNIGSLMHYSNIPSMEDTVICNPQVIFDSISKLIISKFHHGNRALKPCVVDDFLEKGIFELSHIKHKTEGPRSDILAVDKLIDLLLNLNILAEITPETNQPSPSSEHKFIMPTLLKHASEEELKQLTSTSTCISEHEAAPLMIHFEYGFVPFGVFCVTMAHLMKSKSPQWQLYEKQMMKNCVKFNVDKSYYAILISRPQYIEIHIERNSFARKCYSMQDMCNTVKETVVKSMKTVISNMKFKPVFTPFCTTESDSEQLFNLAFTCRCGEDHLMKVTECDGKYFGECLKSDTELNLVKKHLIWFNQAKPCKHHIKTSQPAGLLLPSSTLGDSLSSIMSNKPRFHELDLIEANGKTVRIIGASAAEWEKIATRLYFEIEEIDIIRRDHYRRAINACQQVFMSWLQGKGRSPKTWETVIKVLEEAELTEVASDLKDVLMCKP